MAWPPEMIVTSRNLLRNILFDDELNINKGNDNTVLPSLLKKFRTEFPALAAFKEHKYLASVSEETEPNPDDEFTDAQPSRSNNDVMDPSIQADTIPTSASKEQRTNDIIEEDTTETAPVGKATNTEINSSRKHDNHITESVLRDEEIEMSSSASSKLSNKFKRRTSLDLSD